MSWENYGIVWNIDHIIPLCAFDLTDRFQFCAACYYENLQPLCVEDNFQKSGSYKQEELESYLELFKERRKIIERE